MAAVATEEYVFPQTDPQGGQTGALVIGTIAFDNSYPTGGYTIDAPGGVDYLEMVVSAGSVAARYDKATKKLLLYASNGAAPALLAQVANTTDLSAITAASYFAVRPA